MTRFAGSAVDFTPPASAAAGSGGGYGAAGGIVDINDSYGVARDKAPKYGDLAQASMETRSQERQAATKASADVTAAGIGAVGQTQGAALQARGQIEAAKAQASASKSSGMMSAIGGIASSLIGLSDESTKCAIKPIDSALAKLRALNPVTFYYKPEYGDHTRKHHGFIAQEFAEVVPDAAYTDEVTGKMCIDTVDLIGLLVRANQELEGRLTRLEAKSALQAV